LLINNLILRIFHIFTVPNPMIMKLLSSLLLVCPFYLCAQVGIGTTNPTATLDVNGTLRIRQTNSYISEPAAKDSVLVVNKNGDVTRTSSKQVVNSYIKTFIKGSFSTTADKNLALSSGFQKIPFDLEEFDLNNEYNTSTNTFTAKEAGIYAVYVQIKATSTLSVATNFAVAIVKNTTIAARYGFANISVVGIDVTPPMRSTQTLVQMAAGDTIRFFIYSNLVNVGILGTNEDCFFTIHQVR
jgi:hypothetical protein